MLGYMISQLQSQVVYDKFLDAFGGSGASSVQFKHNKDAEYFINDYHYANICFYKILNGTNSEYKEFLSSHTLYFQLSYKYLQLHYR